MAMPGSPTFILFHPLGVLVSSWQERPLLATRVPDKIGVRPHYRPDLQSLVACLFVARRFRLRRGYAGQVRSGL